MMNRSGTVVLFFATFALIHHALAQNTTTETPAGDEQTSTTSVSNTLANYKFDSDLSEHAKLDLDQQLLENALKESPPGWKDAQEVYVSGRNSKKKTEFRTLQGFSKGIKAKLRGEPYYELFADFYGCSSYADDVVTDALNAEDEFRGTDEIFRVESVKKGTAYLSTWMYVVHELEDAIDDCLADTPTDNDDPAVKAWDEAWAFYAGSLEGPDGTGDGVMLHALAEKRCANFGTCEKGRPAPVNEELLTLWEAGKKKLDARECDKALVDKNNIVKLMTVPLVQGLLRYVSRTKSEPAATRPKQHAEGLAFLRAVLPIIDHCDARAARVLARNFAPNADSPMSDSIESVAGEIYRNLGCMGISCNDIGTLKELPECKTSGTFKAVRFSDKAASENRKTDIPERAATCPRGVLLGRATPSGGPSGGVIAIIVIVVILVIIALILAAYCFMKRRRKNTPIQAIPQDGQLA